MVPVIHEISHQIGAPDHYHEMITINGAEVCRGGELCGTCNPSTGRPTWCVMDDGRGNDIDINNLNNIYCSGCKNDIINHLNNHHYS